MNTRLTDLEYWKARHAVQMLELNPVEPVWYDLVKEYLPAGPDAKFLEIGVVPGNKSLFFGLTHGYECVGVDFSPAVEEVAASFEKRGVRGRFYHEDVFAWEPGELFDVVYSDGFIEHFENYEEAVRRHWDLVAPGGIMLLTVPTLTPAQMLMRKVFYTRAKLREVLEAHNLAVMNLDALVRSCKGLPGARMELATYGMGMTMSFGPRSAGVRKWTWPLFPLARAVAKVMGMFDVRSRLLAQDALVVVRRRP